MKIEAIIFDLDGTLLNTLDDLAGSMNKVLEENSLPTHPSSSYLYFIGGGAKKLVESALPETERTPELIDKYLNRYRDIYRENWNVNTKLYDDIESMLIKLKSLNVPIAVLSNKPHSDVLKCVDYYFKPETFLSVAGQKDSIPHKPAPDGAFNIVNELNVNVENTIFVGDSSVDMKTAKAAKMIAVGVSWGFRTTEELLKNGADHIINNPGQLLSLLN
ncbi:MAG: HAD family hydrolase [Spirochaetaceae bacterium]